MEDGSEIITFVQELKIIEAWIRILAIEMGGEESIDLGYNLGAEMIGHLLASELDMREEKVDEKSRMASRFLT